MLVYFLNLGFEFMALVFLGEITYPSASDRFKGGRRPVDAVFLIILFPVAERTYELTLPFLLLSCIIDLGR